MYFMNTHRISARASRRSNRHLTVVFITVCLLGGWFDFGRAEAISAHSPNGRNEIRVRLTDGALTYEVFRDGRPRIAASAIRPVVIGRVAPASVASAAESARGNTNKQEPLQWGKSSVLIDRCEYVVVDCLNRDEMPWKLDVRAYDDGVAFRFRVEGGTVQTPLQLSGEDTEFRAAGEPKLLYNALDGFQTSHESLYQLAPLDSVPAQKLIDCPALLLWPDGQAAAITEARVRHFAGMYLERPSSDDTVLRTRLSPAPQRGAAAVTASEVLVSPWRVIMLADTAGALLESSLLLCLNDPPQSDFGWVRPGKSTFDWWNGEFEEDYKLAEVTSTFVGRHKKYIDFCARHGIAYHTICGDGRPWYPQTSTDYAAPSSDADLRVSRTELDLPTILAYAKDRDVGIRLWMHWKPLSEHLEEACAEYEKWGVAGLMIDFLDRDDQEMIDFTERALACAARHHLHVQIHGSSKYSGEQRTYPNLFNREGVLNLEYLKWSSLCTPDHSVNVAYTRGLAGPVDYHLGGFRSKSRAAFQPVPLSPVVLGTRCHHMALYLVFENPMPMLADRPDHYEGQAGFDFLCKMPTTWDETRFVAGEPGEYVILARRHGREWFLGGITNWTPRTLDVPLTFLGLGSYAATLYVDGSLDEERPNEISQVSKDLNPQSRLTISVAPGGGFVGRLAPR